MFLPAAVALPIILFEAPSVITTPLGFETIAVPDGFVPMKLPTIELPVAPLPVM